MKAFCKVLTISLFIFNAWILRGAENIVFAGDVITLNGEFRAIAQVYSALRNPVQKLYLLNAGIIGDTAADGLKRLEWDILRHKPAKVFLMFGLSDVRKNVRYSKQGAIIDPASIAEFKKATEEMVEKILASGSKVVLVTPFPYDESAEKTSYNEKLNGTPGFAELTEICKEIAAKRNVELLDVFSEVNKIIAVGNEDLLIFRKNNRTDLGSAGNIALAMLIAENLGAGIPIAEIKVNAAENKYNVNGAELRYFRASDKLVRFTYKPERLPLPVDRNYRNLAKIMDLDKRLNSEILTVTGLPPGIYEFKINGIVIKTFSAEELAKGINMAHLDTTSTRTAKELSALIPRLTAAPHQLRRMAKAESIIRNAGVDPNDKTAGLELLAKSIHITKNKAYHDQITAAYTKNIGQKSAVENQIKAQIDALYSRAAARQFIVEITPLTGK